MDQNVEVPADKIELWVNEQFEKAMPTLLSILEIPSQSRNFDPEYLTNGLLVKTAEIFRDWILSQDVQGLKLEFLTDADYSPFIFCEVPGGDTNDGTVLFYGHMDKQPPFEGWKEGLHPYKPKLIDGKLYARGGADDCYSIFASVLAVKACQTFGLKHPRIVMLFEGDEESGSGHIGHYLDKLKDKIGKVDVVVCLDSGCGNFEQLWMTTSLRGMIATTVTVKVLNEGVHSGDASGIVPSSFRIMRQLLERIEDSKTGEVHEAFQVNVPGERYHQAQKTAAIIGQEILEKFPYADKTEPVSKDPFKGYMNRIWKAQLSVVGADGLPQASVAGNVLRPSTSLRLSIRIPPTKNPDEAALALEKLLTTDVPNNATVTLTPILKGSGFNAPVNEQYLDDIVSQASLSYFKREALTYGEGGSIPLMNTLSRLYPESQFIVTGVLGPMTNAHGPNEFLHIPFTKKLICCMAQTIAQAKKHLQK